MKLQKAVCFKNELHQYPYFTLLESKYLHGFGEYLASYKNASPNTQPFLKNCFSQFLRTHRRRMFVFNQFMAVTMQDLFTFGVRFDRYYSVVYK